MRRRDFLLLIILLCLLSASFFFIFFGQKDGSYVEIKIDGSLVQTLPLYTDTTFNLPLGDRQHNTIVIQNNEVYMKDSDCPDHVCESMGAIDSVGESIICLPHRVVVTIVSAHDESEYDAITK